VFQHGLQGLRIAFGLSSVNIRVVPPPGSDPVSIVRFAIREMTADPEYDRGYCVFDRDQHANFDEAIRFVEISDLGRAGRLFSIASVPCFEIWILLHYRYTTGAYSAVGGESACAQVIRDVRQHFADYQKGHKTAFVTLAPMLNQAIIHAARLEKHNVDTQSINPATQMHCLVKYLRNLRKP
jgi:RloB-like protein